MSYAELIPPEHSFHPLAEGTVITLRTLQSFLSAQVWNFMSVVFGSLMKSGPTVVILGCKCETQ